MSLLGSPVVQAQARLTGADLQGTVTDATGAALPGTAITVTDLETGLLRAATSAADGRYVVPALPPGRYEVVARLSGFAPRTWKGMLRLGQLATADFVLDVSVSDRVTVFQEAPVDASRTSLSTVVGPAQIEGLPINVRNFLGFSLITPGVATDRTPQTGAANTSGLTFAGQHARSNNVTVDGLDNNDAVVGAVRATFSQEAVREFQVLAGSYSAEFGKASGGVVNIVTRSGTNELHGSAFGYFRDERLSARDHFERFDPFGDPVQREKAPFRQDQWGGTLGGPLRRDRTFFFLSFEKLDVRASNFVTIDPAAADVLRATGFAVELGNVPYDAHATGLLAKLDHQWRSGHTLAVRGSFADTTNENIEPWGGITARSRGAVQLRKDLSAAVSQTDVLSPRWLNEARLQFARQDQDVNALDPACDGACDREDEGGPTLEVTGVANVGRQRFTPQPRKNDRVQLTDTVSVFSGRHAAKAGFDYSFVDYRSQALPLQFGGRYIFTALPAIPGLLPAPVSAIEAVRLGLPAAYVQGYGNAASAYHYQDLSLFVQDDWRLSRRLTLKAGVRYQKQFWPRTAYAVSSPGGSTFSYDLPADDDDLAPRLALAWDPKGDGRTSLHAAWGLFFDNQITGIVGITRALDGRNGVRTRVLTFPATLAAWRAPGHRLPEPTTSYPSLVIALDPALKTPWAHQASLGIDRTFRGDLSVSLSAVWVRGRDQLGSIDYNPTLPALGAGRRPDDVDGRAGTSATVLQYTSYGETWYRGLTLGVTKRFRGSSPLALSYTLSKAEDTVADFQSVFPQDQGRGRNPADPTGLPLGLDPRAERGPANHDQRHRFVLSGIVPLPHGFQVSTIVTAGSGRPYTVLAGADLNGDGNGGGTPPDRARRDPADPATSLHRNSETMAGQFQVDLRLSRRFRLGGTASLTAIAEAFNLLDRVNFSEINNVFGRGAYPGDPQRDGAGRVTFGRYEQALAPRQVQLALRLSF
jgi:carboxypeptidase family protein/TonB-dependent receptor-like protein